MKLKSLFKIYRFRDYFIDYLIIPLLRLSWEKSDIKIGKNVKILGMPIFTNNFNGKIEIGNDSLLVSRSSQTALGVSHKVILRILKPSAIIVLGNKTRMSGTTICSSELVQIGDNCVIGADVIIADTDFHSLDPDTRKSEKDGQMANTSPIIIGNDVFIGGKSIILKGVNLGDNVIVGAGSIVTKSFEKNSIIGGNPARLISILK